MYGAAWLVMFIVPFLWEYWQTGTKLNAIDRYELCRTYLTLSVFCVLFWLHNLFVAPRLVYKGQRWRYVLGLTLLIAIFFGYLSYRHTQRRKRPCLPTNRSRPKTREERKTRKRAWRRI